MSKIDNHIHSAFSDDGQFSPSRIFEMAKEKGMKMISIADHNSVEAYLGEPFADRSVEVIPAIELDCTIEGVNLHVLGFGIDPRYPEFEEIRKDIVAQEQVASIKRMKLVEELGIVVDVEKIMETAPNGVVAGELIAEVSLEDPRNIDNEILKPYRAGNNRSDNPFVNFYWDYCAQGKPCYVDVRFITLGKAVEVIHAANGVAVLAHPGNNIHEDETLLYKIIKTGVQGIEVYSSYHSDKQIEFYHQKAKEYNCLITCGSDYHGKNKPSIQIGDPKPFETDEELIEMMHRAIKK